MIHLSPWTLFVNCTDPSTLPPLESLLGLRSTVAIRTESTSNDHDAAASPLRLSPWLQAMSLGAMESILRTNFGIDEPEDIKFGFAEGNLTEGMLQAKGFKPIEAARLRRKAAQL